MTVGVGDKVLVIQTNSGKFAVIPIDSPTINDKIAEIKTQTKPIIIPLSGIAVGDRVLVAPSSGEKNIIIVGTTGRPTAKFTVNQTEACTGFTFRFTDLSLGSPTSWLWNFGDLSTSTAQNPTHRYTANGTYTVSLTATNAFGGNMKTKTNYITVTDTPPPFYDFDEFTYIEAIPYAVGHMTVGGFQFYSYSAPTITADSSPAWKCVGTLTGGDGWVSIFSENIIACNQGYNKFWFGSRSVCSVVARYATFTLLATNANLWTQVSVTGIDILDGVTVRTDVKYNEGSKTYNLDLGADCDQLYFYVDVRGGTGAMGETLAADITDFVYST